MTERLKCLVPGCRRTTGEQHHEWICTAHWRGVDRRLKLRRAAVRRKLLRRGELVRLQAGMYGAKTARAFHILDAIWNQMRGQAIERAAGL